MPGLAITISPGDGRKLGDDLAAGLAVDQDAAHRARVADAQLGLPRRRLAGGQSDRSGLWHSRVWTIGRPAARKRVQQPAHVGHDRLQPGDVVAERFAEAAGLDEVALHVDDDQGEPCRGGQAEGERARPAIFMGLGR